MKKISILGSTGSVGTQALDIIAQSGRFEVFALTCNRSIKLLAEQATRFKPKYVVVQDESMYSALAESLAHLPIQIRCGLEGLIEVATHPEADLVLNAVVGSAGLKPTIAAIQSGKIIALANKETLVTAGEQVMALARKYSAELLPVDSEHSAIFQCLQGEHLSSVRRILLTASGGPFRTLTYDEIALKRASDALKHPKWNMGRKISIDSATLMNKGLELIEARWLFDVSPEKIEIVVHPQSIVHSMVEFEDHSIVAQLGATDMRLPIIYALDYPKRHSNAVEALDFSKIASLTFEKPDEKRFPCLSVAKEALIRGGVVPSIMNAANEEVVNAYLNDRISFYKIPELIQEAMAHFQPVSNPDIDTILAYDSMARVYINERLKLF